MAGMAMKTNATGIAVFAKIVNAVLTKKASKTLNLGVTSNFLTKGGNYATKDTRIRKIGANIYGLNTKPYPDIVANSG